MTSRTERTPARGAGAERLSEDQTLALLRYREKQTDGICPVCNQYLDTEDHADCIEALSPSKVERKKAPMGVDYMAHEENPEV